MVRSRYLRFPIYIIQKLRYGSIIEIVRGQIKIGERGKVCSGKRLCIDSKRHAVRFTRHVKVKRKYWKAMQRRVQGIGRVGYDSAAYDTGAESTRVDSAPVNPLT